MSCDPIPAGQLAAVVTFLEMSEPPRDEVPPSPFRLHRIDQPALTAYRELFRLVGAPWLWFSRLTMGDDELAAIIRDPAVKLFEIIDHADHVAGMLELDFREHGQCELAFIGLVPELAGQGHGRWLLAEALNHAWRDGVERVHVHTCSLDHPAALAAYRRAGFTAFKRAIERFPDPRILGILAQDCAPHIPLIR